jgi:hypothetical protein
MKLTSFEYILVTTSIALFAAVICWAVEILHRM